jgi:hypothetical protein
MQLSMFLVFVLAILTLKDGIEAKASGKKGKKSKSAKGWTWTKNYEGRCEACRALVESASIGLSPESVAPIDQAMQQFRTNGIGQGDEGQKRMQKELIKLIPGLKLCDTHVFTGTSKHLQKACREMVKRGEVKRTLVGMLMNTLRLSAMAPSAGPFEHMLNSTALMCSMELKFCNSKDWTASDERSDWFSLPANDCDACKMIAEDFEAQLHRFDRKDPSGAQDLDGLLEKICRTLRARHRVEPKHIELCDELIADHDYQLQEAARLPVGPARKEKALLICEATCAGRGTREL